MISAKTAFFFRQTVRLRFVAQALAGFLELL